MIIRQTFVLQARTTQFDSALTLHILLFMPIQTLVQFDFYNTGPSMFLQLRVPISIPHLLVYVSLLSLYLSYLLFYMFFNSVRALLFYLQCSGLSATLATLIPLSLLILHHKSKGDDAPLESGSALGCFFPHKDVNMFRFDWARSSKKGARR